MIEQSLINACILNDAAAQRELYNRFSPKMLSICYRFAYNKYDAEDMLQEGFIKVFTQMHTFQNKGAFEGWMRKIIVHTCINFLKKHKKFSESLELTYAVSEYVKEESVASKLQAKQVIDCIRKLPIGYRTVLNLYAIEGYSHREIGEMLSIQESTSRSQFTRAKVMLEHILLQERIIENPKEELNWATSFK